MTCEDARDRLLTADPGELSGGPDTELRRHLATCPGCGQMARELREQQAALGGALARIRPRDDVDRALARLRRRRRMGRLALFGLLAAAVVAALVVLVPGGVPRRPPDARHENPVAAPAPLEVSANRSFAVLSTGDPDVIVLWLY